MATWVVMAASYEARAHGVHSGMHATEAHRRCPGLIAVEPRSEAYGEASRELFEVFDALSPRVERHGMEEAFLEGPPELGERLRAQVRDQVGLPVTVGVASTKIAAKMASRAAKPDGLRIVGDEAAFLNGHRVEQLWGIGQATATKLHARGIATVGEAAALGEPELVALLGRGNGRRVHALVNNRDKTPVERGGPPRSFGSTRSLGRGGRPAPGAGGRGRTRRATPAIERKGGPNDHAASALRRPHAGRPLAHSAGGDGRRDDDPLHRGGAAGHPAHAHADRRQRGQPRGGG